MHWIETLDIGLFRLINQKLANPFFDQVMPLLSGNAFFYPILLLLGILLVWKGRARGLVCMMMLLLILPLGDHWICRNIKRAIERPRPFAALDSVHRPGVAVRDPETPKPVANDAEKAKASASSMPSSHAANWFAATLIAFIYYRHSLKFMLPAALLVAFSRVYNGMHYPSDVLAGTILGAGYAAAAVWLLAEVWKSAGRRWFPLWWESFPSLIECRLANAECGMRSAEYRGSMVELVESHYLRLGYILIGILLVARLIYIAGDTIQLTGDEAYQWLWSKHLALSYYSKPPLIAYTQFLGTSLFGDTAFGVRFFSPVIGAVLSFMLLRFLAREVNGRVAFFMVLVSTATPLVSAGAVLMTVDVLSVLFWTAAMVAGWRAVQPQSSTSSWLRVGLWMGLGFLSKYTELFQWLCWTAFFLLCPKARPHLRRPGPYLALLVNLIFTLPVLIWNYQHQWVTVGHVASDAKAGEPWSFTLNHLSDFLGFLGSEALLFNPIFFVGIVWTTLRFWRSRSENPFLVYLFSMGAPLFLVYMFYTFHSRVLPNWIVPSVLPLFCFMVVYWEKQWRLGIRFVKPLFIAAVVIGTPVIIIGHDTYVLAKLTGHYLPVNQDPLHRARGWKDVAHVAQQARTELLAEGKPVFIIGAHYRLAGELSFYLPKIATNDLPAVFCETTDVPQDQFYFWPGYSARKGENAILVQEISRDEADRKPIPKRLSQEFESVQDLGFREVLDHGRVLWRLQFFACRNLR